MTDRSAIRRKAADAARLLEDAALREVLSEIEEEAKAAFLASGGNPDRMAAAFEKVRAAETVRARLQARIADEAVEAKREQ